jgi:hypothetical protein
MWMSWMQRAGPSLRLTGEASDDTELEAVAELVYE